MCISLLGVAFLLLKIITIPFVPNRNIDNMSDYYTAVWSSVRGNHVDNGRFTVIDISENNRHEISEILKIVNKMGPSIIGIDVSHIWEENKNDDSLLINTILSLPNVVLPVEYHNTKDNGEKFMYSIFYDQLKDLPYGVVSFPKTREVLRTYYPHFQIGDQKYDAFSCIIAKKTGTDISYIYNKKKWLINYTTLNLTDEDALPAFQLLHLNTRDSLFLASQIKDRIILLGSTNLTNDQHLTPLGNTLSGVMIHAHIINSIIENKNIKTTPVILRYFLCFIFALLVIEIYNKRSEKLLNYKSIWKKILYSFFVFFVSLILFSLLGTTIFCKMNYYIDFTPYLITLIIIYLIRDKYLILK